MKSLFNETAGWTQECDRFDDCIKEGVEKAFEIAREEGYSPRDVSHILHLYINLIEGREVARLKKRICC